MTSGAVYDERSGVVYARVTDQSRSELEGAVQFGTTWYVPHRRHLHPDALRAELGRAGFRVVWQDGQHGGNVICAASSSGHHASGASAWCSTWLRVMSRM